MKNKKKTSEEPLLEKDVHEKEAFLEKSLQGKIKEEILKEVIGKIDYTTSRRRELRSKLKKALDSYEKKCQEQKRKQVEELKKLIKKVYFRHSFKKQKVLLGLDKIFKEKK